MMTRYPVDIRVTSAGETFRVKAATSIDKVVQGTRNLESELRGIETDYAVTLAAVARALKEGHRARGSDPRAYWLAGKHLHDFLTRLESQGYYLVRKNHSMAKALGIGRASVEKIISFYLRYESPLKIDLSIPWATHRDNKARRGTR
jgi:hypothetical protein